MSPHESHDRRVKQYRASLRSRAPEPVGGRGATSSRSRIFALVLATVLVAGGFFVLGQGGIGYRNYWGGTIFAPTAIAIGVFLFLLVLFRWQRLNRTAAHLDATRALDPKDRGVWWRSWWRF
jgi:hypothetical protein